MKVFVKWLLIAVIIFGGSAACYHFYLESNPRKIMVVIDASFPMNQIWDKIPGVLAGLENRKYTKYALASDKGLIHGWMDSFKLGRTVPYAPRNLKDLDKRLSLSELKESSEIYLLTSAVPEEITGVGGWKIIRIE